MENLKESEMLSKGDEDLRTIKNICYHLNWCAELIYKCSDLGMIAKIK